MARTSLGRVDERVVVQRYGLTGPQLLDLRHRRVCGPGVAGPGLDVRDEAQIDAARHARLGHTQVLERLAVTVPFGERARQQGARGRVRRVLDQRLLEVRDRVVVLPLEEEVPRHIAVDDDRERLELLRPSDLGHRFVLPAHRVQMIGVPMVRQRVLIVQREGLLEAALGAVPVPVVKERGEGERRVGLDQIRIALERLHRGFLREPPRFERQQRAEGGDALRDVHVRHPRPGRRVGRIQFRRLLEIVETALQ